MLLKSFHLPLFFNYLISYKNRSNVCVTVSPVITGDWEVAKDTLQGQQRYQPFVTELGCSVC